MRYTIQLRFREGGSTFYPNKFCELVSDRKFAAKFWTYRGAQEFILANQHQHIFRVPCSKEIRRG